MFKRLMSSVNQFKLATQTHETHDAQSKSFDTLQVVNMNRISFTFIVIVHQFYALVEQNSTFYVHQTLTHIAKPFIMRCIMPTTYFLFSFLPLRVIKQK